MKDTGVEIIDFYVKYLTDLYNKYVMSNSLRRHCNYGLYYMRIYYNTTNSTNSIFTAITVTAFECNATLLGIFL